MLLWLAWLLTTAGCSSSSSDSLLLDSLLESRDISKVARREAAAEFIVEMGRAESWEETCELAAVLRASSS